MTTTDETAPTCSCGERCTCGDTCTCAPGCSCGHAVGSAGQQG